MEKNSGSFQNRLRAECSRGAQRRAWKRPDVCRALNMTALTCDNYIHLLSLANATQSHSDHICRQHSRARKVLMRPLATVRLLQWGWTSAAVINKIIKSQPSSKFRPSCTMGAQQGCCSAGERGLQVQSWPWRLKCLPPCNIEDGYEHFGFVIVSKLDSGPSVTQRTATSSAYVKLKSTASNWSDGL